MPSPQSPPPSGQFQQSSPSFDGLMEGIGNTLETLRLNHRQQTILESVRLAGACSISDLASRLQVSEETVRRDVRPLSSAGLIIKQHGAVAWPERRDEPPLQRRLMENMAAKESIARAAARLIGDGDTVMLDTGSTTNYVARALRGRKGLMAVTNSIDIARTLSSSNADAATVHLAGGEMRADDGAMFGQAAIDFVSQFWVSTAILSCGGVDAELGVIDYHLSEAEFARAIIRRARRVVVVADASKFARLGNISVCPLANIHVLVTNAAPHEELARALERAGVEVMIAS